MAKAVAPPSLRCVGARRSINIKILIASDTILMLFHCRQETAGEAYPEEVCEEAVTQYIAPDVR